MAGGLLALVLILVEVELVAQTSSLSLSVIGNLEASWRASLENSRRPIALSPLGLRTGCAADRPLRRGAPTHRLTRAATCADWIQNISLPPHLGARRARLYPQRARPLLRCRRHPPLLDLHRPAPGPLSSPPVPAGVICARAGCGGPALPRGSAASALHRC